MPIQGVRAAAEKRPPRVAGAASIPAGTEGMRVAMPRLGNRAMVRAQTMFALAALLAVGALCASALADASPQTFTVTAAATRSANSYRTGMFASVAECRVLRAP
jgi:hypothetical protein